MTATDPTPDPTPTPPPAQATRCIIEVTAGVIPGTPDPSLTKQYAITSDAWELVTDSDTKFEVLSETIGKAQGYSTWLMLQPNRYNWVRTEWIWM